MDPSASVCISYDSLKQAPPKIEQVDPIGWYSIPNRVQLQFSPELITVQSAPPPQYCDVDRYNALQKLKDAFDNEGFIEARNSTNPFENIGRSIFINRAAVKLANIDAVHHISGKIFTFDAQQSDQDFIFCDIAAGPGGFTQYLQYRFPKSIGYGMTLKHPTLDWSTRFLDMSRFTPFYGPDETGNLYTNWRTFIEFFLQKHPYGADLVTGDGGFDLEETDDKTLLHRQEFLSSRLLLTQATIGIACTKASGNFVLKVFDTVTHFSAQILYILAQCFREILIFKPVSSRPANSERYIICRDRYGDINPYLHLLAYAASSYQDDVYLNRLFPEPLPEDFVNWLVQANSYSINQQLETGTNILLTLNGNRPNLPMYDVDKFLVIWNLPETPSKRDSVASN
jgi:cap1 methyltransferase